MFRNIFIDLICYFKFKTTYSIWERKKSGQRHTQVFESTPIGPVNSTHKRNDVLFCIHFFCIFFFISFLIYEEKAHQYGSMKASRYSANIVRKRKSSYLRAIYLFSVVLSLSMVGTRQLDWSTYKLCTHMHIDRAVLSSKQKKRKTKTKQNTKLQEKRE